MVALRLYADGMLIQNKVAPLALQRTGVSKQQSKNKVFVVYMHYIFSCQKSGKKTNDESAESLFYKHHCERRGEKNKKNSEK